ncbi:MAG: tetratricopeptide repeat protein [Pseudomonadota bacterium]
MSIILKALKKSEKEEGKEKRIEQDLGQGFFLGKTNKATIGFLSGVDKLSSKKNIKLGLILVLVLGFGLGIWWWYKSSATVDAPPKPVEVEEKEAQSAEVPFSQPASPILPTDTVAQAKQAFELGNLDKSAELYRLAINEKPGDADLHNNLGLVYQQKGLFANASTEFQKALELDDACVSCFNNFGLLKSSLGEVAEAQKYFEQAISLDPAYPNPYFNLAVLHEKSGDVGNAVKYYRQFISLYPDQQADVIFKVNRRINALTGK